MLTDVEIECPSCGRTTVIAVAEPDRDGRMQKLSVTRCRKCSAQFIALTFPDGAVEIQPVEAATSTAPDASPKLEIPSPFALSDLVQIAPSIWQPRRDTVKQFDHRPEWVAALDEVLKEKQSNPRPLSVPRRIFISYRWSTPEKDDWVLRLAERLVARGNSIVFDRHVQQEPVELSVPELVSRIADCHFTFVVLDGGYVERITARSRKQSPEGWVWDEFQTALAFADAGLTKIIGLLREDTPLPDWFVPFQPYRAGNTFDVREEKDMERMVDRFFRQSGTAPDAERARKAAELLHYSAFAEQDGQIEQADSLAAEAARLVPEVPDGHARRAHTAYFARKYTEAFAAARRALEIEPGNEEALTSGAAAAGDLGQWEDCMRLARVALVCDRTDYNAHCNIGRGLSARGQFEPALAHLNIARAGFPHAAPIHAAAARAYRKIGRSVEAAQCLQAALREAPEHRHEEHLTNLAAAWLEAGDANSARQIIATLSSRYPDNRALPLLTAGLDELALDGPPLDLIGGIRPPAGHGVASCDNCSAEVHFADRGDFLCVGCGALLHRSGVPEPCPYCGADGGVDLLSAVGGLKVSFGCPYCRAASLSITEGSG